MTKYAYFVICNIFFSQMNFFSKLRKIAVICEEINSHQKKQNIEWKKVLIQFFLNVIKKNVILYLI